MTKDPASYAYLALLALITCALYHSLRVHGPWLAKELKAGHDSARYGKASSKPPKVFADPLSGVSAELPDSVTVQVSALGVLMKRDSDAMKAALVCPLVADASIAPSEILTGIHAVWNRGLKDGGDSLTMGFLHDEGSVVHASIESGRGIEAISGQMRVRRTPAGLQLEAFWTAKDEYDRERAGLDALVKAVRLGTPAPFKVELGKRHQAAVPSGWAFSEDEDGIEVKNVQEPRLVFGLATGVGRAGLTRSEQLIDKYLTGSQGLTNPTTGLSRAYPTFGSPPGQAWDVTARDLEYEVNGQPVRAVITAALTGGPKGDAFMLSVRQAPPERWGESGFVLAAIESTARFYPKGFEADGLTIPISHPETTWELLEGWALNRAARTGLKVPWREAMLPTELMVGRSQVRWAFSPWLAQPDGRYASPQQPFELLTPLQR